MVNPLVMVVNGNRQSFLSDVLTHDVVVQVLEDLLGGRWRLPVHTGLLGFSGGRMGFSIPLLTLGFLIALRHDNEEMRTFFALNKASRRYESADMLTGISALRTDQPAIVSSTATAGRLAAAARPGRALGGFATSIGTVGRSGGPLGVNRCDGECSAVFNESDCWDLLLENPFCLARCNTELICQKATKSIIMSNTKSGHVADCLPLVAQVLKVLPRWVICWLDVKTMIPLQGLWARSRSNDNRH